MHQLPRRKKDTTGGENAEALLISLFREAIAKDADAIDAMHTLLDLLGPRGNGSIVLVFDKQPE